MIALLLVALAGVLAIAVGFHLSVHQRREPRISWHRVAFASVFFWLWYLAPGLGDGSAIASVISLLTP